MNPETVPNLSAEARLADRVAALERRLAQLERSQQFSRTVVVSDGTRIRVEWGQTASGRYGIRVYDNAGVLTYDWSTAA